MVVRSDSEYTSLLRTVVEGVPLLATLSILPDPNLLWWSQMSRQFLVENKTKHNHSRKLVLSARIDLRWRLIVQRLMKALLIVKQEVRSQVAHGI